MVNKSDYLRILDDFKENIRISIAQIPFNLPKEEIIYENHKIVSNDNNRKITKYIERAVKGAELDKTDILIFPELCINDHNIKFLSTRVNPIKIDNPEDINYLSVRKEYIIIAGHFYKLQNSTLKNVANIFLPTTKLTRKRNFRNFHIEQDKLEVTIKEKKYLEKLKQQIANIKFLSGNRIYLFESKKIGNFAILICYDFTNINVIKKLQGTIQHLIVIAYNRDLPTYFSLVETFSRLLLCNVVVCNTGKFGGSIVMSPYYNKNKRIRLKIIGNNVFSLNTVEIPVKSLICYQNYQKEGMNCNNCNSNLDKSPVWKDKPQSFSKNNIINLEEKSI